MGEEGMRSGWKKRGRGKEEGWIEGREVRGELECKGVHR